MNNLSKNLTAIFGFLKNLGVTILALIGFLTSVISLIQLQRNENTRFWLTSLVSAVAVVWIVCLYVFLKKASIEKKIGFKKGDVHQSYLFGNRQRMLAMAGIVLVPTFCWLGYYRWQYIRNLPSDKTIILVANFESLDGQNYGVTEKIIEQLRERISQYPDVQITALNESITAQQGSSQARSVAQDNKARIFLWGWYRKTQESVLITAHFEVIQKPAELVLRRDKQELIRPAREMDSFQTQTRLSNEMAYLSLLTVGLVRLEAHDYRQAISLFSEALKGSTAPAEMIDPANIYYFRGNSYLSVGSYREAVADLTESLTITPENFCTACALNNRASAYSSLSDLDAALADFLESRKHNPAPAEIHFNLGLIYERKGDVDSAIRSYTEAISRNPDFVDAYNNRADLYFRRKEYSLMIGDCNEILKRQPANWQIQNNRGLAYAKSGDYERAIDDLNQSKLRNTNTAPDQESPHLIDKQSFIREMASSTALIKSDPKRTDAYVRRAALYNSITDYADAIDDLEKAIGIRDDIAEAYHQRGKAYEGMGIKAKAIADYSRFLELANNDAARQDARQHLRQLGIAE